MWCKIFCYCCFKRGKGPKLTASEKRKKFCRLVVVMSIRKYLTHFVANFYFAFLFADTLFTMNNTFNVFEEFSDCNTNYTEKMTDMVVGNFTQAAEEFVYVASQVSECIAGTMDVEVPGLGVDVGAWIGDFFGDILGWVTPADVQIPGIGLDFDTDADEVLRKLAHDFSFLGSVSFWLRFVGFIMTFATIFVILLKAAFYTLENQPWKPGTVGMAKRFIEFLWVIGIYFILLGAVNLHIYVTKVSCGMSITGAAIKIPRCGLFRSNCSFACVLQEPVITNSTCPEICNGLTYDIWYDDLLRWTNILLVIYVIVLIIMVVYEIFEAGKQKTELIAAAEKEAEEKRRLKESKSKRRKKKKPTEPVEEQFMEDYNDVYIEIDGDEDRPKKKKKKKSKSKSLSEIDDPDSLKVKKKKSKRRSKSSKPPSDSDSQEIPNSEIQEDKNVLDSGPSSSSHRL